MVGGDGALGFMLQSVCGCGVAMRCLVRVNETGVQC